jgi:6-methylsalicylate decarboxylase
VNRKIESLRDAASARELRALQCASRRKFLSAMVCAGAGFALSGTPLGAQGEAAARRIDVHHHFVPNAYLAFAKTHNVSPRALQWSFDADLQDMDQSSTATAILSITTPGFGFGTVEEVRKVVRECNEAAAKLAADHPSRFGSFAALPMTDAEGALAEIAYALDMLKADGLGVFSSYGEKWLGHASFAPIYEELNRRKAVVFIHPTTPVCCANLSLIQDGVPNEGPMIEYGTDTTRTIADLIFSGTTRRFPDITWICSHGGGVMPYIIERFFQSGTSAEVVPGVITKGQDFPPSQTVPKGEEMLHELRKMYYDTAQSSNPVAMGALRKVVPVSQIVFGTDYWYRTAAETHQALEAGKVFSAQELLAINRINAERILPRYRRA